MALESRPETCTVCTPGSPPPLPRNAGMRSPMPYKHAINSIALLAGTLKNGSRYGHLVTPWPARHARNRESPMLTHLPLPPQCPRTCGGGTQHRRVTCRQLLTDGSFLNLSDGLCQGPKASSHKSCARTDCPPHLAVGDWSKVSTVPTCAVPAFLILLSLSSPR